MFLSKWFGPLLVLATVGFLSSLASAGTIRHDANPQDYLDLATFYPSVGLIDAGAWSGSGVLIDPNWVLTAAHVVDGAASLTFDIAGGSYVAANWIAHPKWNGALGKGYDIGLAKFLTEIPVEPAVCYTGKDEFGQIGTSVGFGMTGDGLTGAVKYDGEKRAGENYIDRWLRTPGKTPRVFLSDFDNPENPDAGPWDELPPLPLEYLIAYRDSGGGVFSDFGVAGGPDLLIGIHSFGWELTGDPEFDADYGDASGHTRVSVFNDWIDSILSGGNGNGNGKGPPPGKGPPWKRGGDLALNSAAVPEPSTLWLLCMGGLCLIACWWRKSTR